MARFKKRFEDIVNYFCGRESTLKDQMIYGEGWVLRFTESHQEKNIELEEDKKPGSAGYGKFPSQYVAKVCYF